MKEPGVPSSQTSRIFAIPSVPTARDHPDAGEARVEWSMDPPHAPSWSVHSTPATCPVAKSIFPTFFAPFSTLFPEETKAGASFPSLHRGNIFSSLSQHHLEENFGNPAFLKSLCAQEDDEPFVLEVKPSELH